jgi:HD-GYP domain-containing protein (c-di-GMP phosphodiesterase class II)
LQAALSAALTDQGWQCETVAAVADLALRKSAEPPLVVFLDLEAAGADWSRVVFELRGLYPEAAVVLKTSNLDEKSLLEWMHWGANDVLRKPVSAALLAACAEHWASVPRAAGDKAAGADGPPARQMLTSAIHMLVELMEAKDKFSVGYAREVGALAEKITQAMHLPDRARHSVRVAALLHDVGRVALEDAVVNKKTELTPAEQQHVATHIVMGERILQHLFPDSDVPLVVRHHHEWFNGRGYPDRLKGEEIPVGSRILAVADAYVAMTQDRPHRPRHNAEETLREVCVRAGTQFCPKVVAALLDALGYRPSQQGGCVAAGATGVPVTAASLTTASPASAGTVNGHNKDHGGTRPAVAHPPGNSPAPAATPPEGLEPAAAGSDDGPLSPKEIQWRLKQVMDLRALPNIVSEIVAMTADEDRNISDVAAKIKCDHALATKLLRLANSAFYGARMKVESIDRAVVKLGLDRVRQLVIGVSVVDQWQESQQVGRVNRRDFWQHSMAAALLAPRIADACGLDYSEAAFTAGLLHDIGLLVMQEALGQRYTNLLEKVRAERLFLPAAERAHFEVDHASVMRAIGHNWNMPEELVEGIAWHHGAWDEVQKLSPRALQFVLCIRAADVLSSALGFGDSRLESIEMIPETFLNFLGLKREKVDKMVEDIAGQVEQLGKTYGLATDEPAPAATADRKPPERRGHYVSEGEATLDPVWHYLAAAGAQAAASSTLQSWKQEAGSAWCWVRAAGPAFTREIIASLQSIPGDAAEARRNLLLLLPSSSPEAMRKLLTDAGIQFLIEPWSLAVLHEHLNRVRALKKETPAVAENKK